MSRFFRCRNKLLLSTKGALLIEVLLAIVILSTSLTLIIQSLMASLRATVYSSDYTTAVFLMDDKMFEVMHKEFVDAGFSEEGQFDDPFSRYGYKIAVAKPNDLKDEEDLVNEVNVDIVWVSGSKEKKISATTYVLNVQEKQQEEGQPL